MYLHTVEPKTAAQLAARLCEVERIEIRRASPDRLEYLRTTMFASDGPVSSEAITEVKQLLDKRFSEFDTQEAWWIAQTWAL